MRTEGLDEESGAYGGAAVCSGLAVRRQVPGLAALLQ